MGWRYLTGLDIEVKAERYLEQILHNLGGREQFAAVDVQLIRSDNPDGNSNEEAHASLRVIAVQPTPKRSGDYFMRRLLSSRSRRFRATQEGEIPSAVAAPASFTGRR